MERFAQMLDWWVEGLLDWLEPVVLSAAYAALLAPIILAVNVVGRRWLSARQMALLWGLVLIRLALPAAPSTSVSLGTLWTRATVALDQHLATEGPLVFSADLMASPDALAVGGTAALDLKLPEPSVVPAAVAAESEADPLWATLLSHLASAIVAVFPFVASGIIAWTALMHWRLCVFLRRQSPTGDERLLRILEDARSAAGIRRAVRLHAMADQQQPAVTGLWSPAILLPLEAADLPDGKLHLLLLHELAHVRRGDIVVNWLLAALRAAHWWNPVFWLAASRYRALREQACDAFAITNGSDGATRDYGEMLLHFASAGARRPRWLVSIPASLLGISPAGGRFRMRRRLRALRLSTRRPSGLQRSAFAVLAVMLAISGWTQAKDIERPVADPWIPLTFGTWDWRAPQEELGEIVSIEIDASAALRRLRDAGLTPEVAEQTLTSHIAPLLSVQSIGSQSEADRERAHVESRIAGDRVTLRGPQKVADEVSRLIAIWGESGFRQICLECRIVNAQSDLASATGIGWQSMGQIRRIDPLLHNPTLDQRTFVGASVAVEQPLPVCVAALNKSQVVQFVRAAQGDRKSNVMFAPKVTVFNGTSARLATMMAQPFVVGVQETETGELKPTIKTIEEGLTLSLRPTDNPEGSRMQLTGRLELCDISKVTTAAARTKLGKDVNVQIPHVNRVCIDLDSTIEDGETLLMGCLPSFERREFVYLMITPKRLDDIDDLGREVPSRRSAGNASSKP
jgi:beta-lactamase regulating signal transducer with metallopeptidase domain